MKKLNKTKKSTDEDSSVECDGCGQIVHDDDVEIVGDQVLCHNCISKYYRRNEYWQESGKSHNWMGVPGAKFIYHGDWSDPEIVYDGFSINYVDVEDVLLSAYREDNPDDKNDKGFDDWLEKQSPEWVKGILDDAVYGYYGDQIESAEDWLGIKDAYLLHDIKSNDDFVMYNGKRLEMSDIASELGYDLYYDRDEFDEFVDGASRKPRERKALRNALTKCASAVVVSESLEDDVLSMSSRTQEIEGQLKKNEEQLYNMLDRKYKDNDYSFHHHSKFDELLEERDALVEELCGCKRVVKESDDYLGSDEPPARLPDEDYGAWVDRGWAWAVEHNKLTRQKIKDIIEDIVGDEDADYVFGYWDRIQSGFNSAWKERDGFYGDCYKHLDRLADILGSKGKDIIDDIRNKYSREAKSLREYYDTHSYTGD